MQFALDIALLAHRQALVGKQATIQLVHDHQCGGERNAGAPLPSRGHLSRQGQGRRRQRPDMVWPPAGWRGEATTDAGRSLARGQLAQPHHHLAKRSATASACARWCCHSSPWRVVAERAAEWWHSPAPGCTRYNVCARMVSSLAPSVPRPQGNSSAVMELSALLPPRTCGTGGHHVSCPAQGTTFFPMSCVRIAATSSSVYRPTVRQRDCTTTTRLLLVLVPLIYYCSTASSQPRYSGNEKSTQIYIFSSGQSAAGRARASTGPVQRRRTAGPAQGS